MKIHEVDVVTLTKELRTAETCTATAPHVKKGRIRVRGEKKAKDVSLLRTLQDGHEVSRTEWQQKNLASLNKVCSKSSYVCAFVRV